MIRNQQLIGFAKSFARGRKDCDEINALIEQYEVACGLSTGPDASRCKVWERKAAERRNVLRETVRYTE
jgi:hypothetical protein